MLPVAELHLHIEGTLEPDLLACVNSDDPAYFGGYVDGNLAAVRSAFGFDAWLAASTRLNPTLANPAST
jgi:adenosine deaminase